MITKPADWHTKRFCQDWRVSIMARAAVWQSYIAGRLALGDKLCDSGTMRRYLTQHVLKVADIAHPQVKEFPSAFITTQY